MNEFARRATARFTLERLVHTKLPKLTPNAVHQALLAYDEGWKRYHYSMHILRMMRGLEHPAVAAALPNAATRTQLRYMIWYHDVWYKVGHPHGTNERESARWARNDLTSVEDGAVVDLVETGILATIDHTLQDVAEDDHLVVGTLLDLDLAGIGDSRTFHLDAQALREEAQPYYTEVEYSEKLRHWADRTLSRTQIYHTPAFAHREPIARRNLQQLLS